MSKLCNLHETAIKYKVSSNKLFELCYDENIRFFINVDKDGFVLQEIEKKSKNFLTDKELFELINTEESKDDSYMREKTPEDYFYQIEDSEDVEEIAKLLTPENKKKIISHWEIKRNAIIEFAKHIVEIHKENPELFKTENNVKTLRARFIAEQVELSQASIKELNNLKKPITYKKIYDYICKAINSKIIQEPNLNSK